MYIGYTLTHNAALRVEHSKRRHKLGHALMPTDNIIVLL